jgi:preprotein translocase subunit SecB
MDLQIQLKHIQVTELNFKLDSFEQKIPIPLETNLGFGFAISDEIKNVFAIIFDLKLEDKEKKFILSLKATAHFETDKPIDSDFQNSPFAKINAPAIAFPYIRTFVSNLTLNSGLNPIFLPSFNFVKLAADKKED